MVKCTFERHQTPAMRSTPHRACFRTWPHDSDQGPAGFGGKVHLSKYVQGAYHPCCDACLLDPCPAALGIEQALAPGTVRLHSHESMPTQHSPAIKAISLTTFPTFSVDHCQQSILVSKTLRGDSASQSSQGIAAFMLYCVSTSWDVHKQQQTCCPPSC